MTDFQDIERIAYIIAFSAHKAIGQKRKYTGVDYIHHPMEVRQILKDANINDPVMLASALLHDVIEDTHLKLDDLPLWVGIEVTMVVAMLTDISRPEDGNRAVRKKIDREHYLEADYRGKTVKLADVISNGRDIARNDVNFATVYFKEISLLLPFLQGGDMGLMMQANKMVEDYYTEVEQMRLDNALRGK